MNNYCVSVWNPVKKEMTLKAFFDGYKAANNVFEDYIKRTDFAGMEIKLWHYIDTNCAPVSNGTFEWCIMKSNSIKKL